MANGLAVPANTSLLIRLVDGQVIVNGPLYNRQLCVKMLRKALEALGDNAADKRHRLVLPSDRNLEDLYHRGRKKPTSL